MKYYIGKIEERNGEREYTFNWLFTSKICGKKSPEDYMSKVAETWYGEKGEKYDDWFEFFGGEILARVINHKEITVDEFEVLREYI